jgi:exonuclease SbcC
VRPLVLTMQAFGPYKACETVDFTELGNSRLFLIHGETGAGKTSILDAIVFALYGETSGGERSGTQMRCETADPSRETRVTFDFALGPSTFRIERTPTYRVAGRRTPKQASAAFWETTGADTGNEGKLLASQVRETNDEVLRRLGFSASQFRQVVVLPQGRFRELLSASSNEREAILKQLFGTVDCADLEVRLQERAREIREQLRLLKSDRGLRLGAVGAVDDARLEALIVEARGAVAERTGEARAAQKDAEAAGAALAEARVADEAAQRLDAAEQLVAGLGARQPAVDELKDAVAAARRAEKVAPSAEALEAAVKDLRQAEAQLAEAGSLLTRKQDGAQAAAGALEDEEARAAEREAAAEKVRGLTELRHTVVRWRAAEEQHVGAEAAHVAAAAELQRAGDALKTAQAARDQAHERIARAEKAGAELEAVEQRRDRARELVGLCERREAVRGALEKAKADRSEAETAYADALAAFDSLQAECADLEAAARAGRAAAIARELVAGEPCPVCGSTTHPAPAHGAEDVVDEATLDEARGRLETARAAKDLRKQGLSAADTAAATAQVELAGLRRQVADEVSVGQAELDADACDAERAALAEAVAAVADRAEVEAAAAEALEAAEKRLSEADRSEREAARGLAETSARARDLAAAVPEALRAPAALEKALQAAQGERDALAVALATAQKAHGEAREALVAAQRDLKAAEDGEDRERRAESAARQAFRAGLAQQGFETAEAFAAAVMSEEQLSAAEAEIATHAQQVAAARDRRDQARLAVHEHPLSAALADVQRRADEALEASRQAQRLLSEADGRLTGLERVRRELDALDEKAVAVEARFAIVGRLAEVAAGQAGGGKVSFQRWVLGRHLDTVLLAASRRLWTMSGQRYTLVRQREAADLRRASGLDLAVRDTWSNTERPAVTLSGGESFLAALSLALGLAETVQMRSGAISLETIFVDEGFGALDQSALDQAMDALLGLRDAGRLVGVISHVPELRQVIEARLEVKGGPAGSHTEIFAPQC